MRKNPNNHYLSTYKKVIFLTLLSFLMTGCGQKVEVSATLTNASSTQETDSMRLAHTESPASLIHNGASLSDASLSDASISGASLSEASMSEASISGTSLSATSNSLSSENTGNAALQLEITPPAFEEYDITLMAVGDNLIHMGVVRTGQKADNTYDYSFLFEGIKDYLACADIKIINQETILGGNELGFSGYPHFNSPVEIGDAIADAGFNVVLQASNHTADQGIKGMDSCYEFWKTHPEVLMVGLNPEITSSDENITTETTDTTTSYIGAEAANAPSQSAISSGSAFYERISDIPVMTIKDKTFAVLNYTYGPNQASLPASWEGRFDMLCNVNPNTRLIDYTTLNPQVLEDIQLAETLADMVIVCPHWGTEYTPNPSSYQKEFARAMTEAGADIIIGTHPHVVQPVEWIQSENGNISLCYYSLGNYVSTQQNGRSMLEAMAWVTLHVTENDIVFVPEKTGAIPLVCHYTSGPVRIENIYPLEAYTEEKAARHGIISYGGISFHLSDLIKWSEEVIGPWILSTSEILKPIASVSN